MRHLLALRVALALGLAWLLPGAGWAQGIEDLPIEDTVPAINGTPQPTAMPLDADHEPHPSYDTHQEQTPPAEIAADTPSNILDTFSIPFMQRALVAGLLVAAICAYLGVFVVLRRIVFVGVALAETSSAGIALGLLAGFEPILGAIALMLLGVLLFSLRLSPRRLPSETFIGIVYSVAGAFGILLIAKSAHGETYILKLLQGDVLTVPPEHIWQAATALGLVAILHLVAAKEFLFTAFDREAARTLGLRVGLMDFLFYLSLGVTIAFSIRAVGVLLTAAALILPPATALLLAPRLRPALWLAPFCGMIPVVIGLHLSLMFDYPASAAIVAVSFCLLLPALLYSSLARR